MGRGRWGFSWGLKERDVGGGGGGVEKATAAWRPEDVNVRDVEKAAAAWRPENINMRERERERERDLFLCF